MHLYPVALDLGHGGKDPGASGNGMLEKNLNWNIGMYVGEGLKKHGIPYYILCLQDENPSLAERAKRARDWGAELLISIHHNAGKGDGYEIYHQAKNGIDDKFAYLLAAEFKAAGQNAHNKGVSVRQMPSGSDYYGILRECAAKGVPAIISEFCYVDSKDAEIADTYTEQKQIEAAAIVKAICKLCEVRYVGI